MLERQTIYFHPFKTNVIYSTHNNIETIPVVVYQEKQIDNPETFVIKWGASNHTLGYMQYKVRAEKEVYIYFVRTNAPQFKYIAATAFEAAFVESIKKGCQGHLSLQSIWGSWIVYKGLGFIPDIDTPEKTLAKMREFEKSHPRGIRVAQSLANKAVDDTSIFMHLPEEAIEHKKLHYGLKMRAEPVDLNKDESHQINSLKFNYIVNSIMDSLIHLFNLNVHDHTTTDALTVLKSLDLTILDQEIFTTNGEMDVRKREQMKFQAHEIWTVILHVFKLLLPNIPDNKQIFNYILTSRDLIRNDILISTLCKCHVIISNCLNLPQYDELQNTCDDNDNNNQTTNQKYDLISLINDLESRLICDAALLNERLIRENLQAILLKIRTYPYKLNGLGKKIQYFEEGKGIVKMRVSSSAALIHNKIEEVLFNDKITRDHYKSLMHYIIDKLRNKTIQTKSIFKTPPTDLYRYIVSVIGNIDQLSQPSMVSSTFILNNKV